MQVGVVDSYIFCDSHWDTVLLFIASGFLKFYLLLVCKLEHCTFDDVLDLMQFNNKMSGSDSCYEVSK